MQVIIKYGTTLRNPVRRAGSLGYTPCTYCRKLFTQLGISRHWDRCKDNPKNKSTAG